MRIGILICVVLICIFYSAQRFVTQFRRGLEAVAADYARARVVGNVLHYMAVGGVYLLTFFTFAGLLYLNYTQMPPTKAIKKLWAL